jgi:uncharacterized protein
MTISLYEATVPTFIQIVGAAQGFFAKAAKHCEEHGINADELVPARLIADMLPLSFQVASIAKHSVGGIEDVKKGSFNLPQQLATTSFAGLQQELAQTATQLAKYTREEIDALQGREVAFKLPSADLKFTAENYLLSFALPNFLFHSATAYDILRMKGIPLGKRDFLGALRIKQ